MSTTTPSSLPTEESIIADIKPDRGGGETSDEADIAAKLTPSLGKKFPCSACGASLVFDPTAQSLKCGYCGHQEKIPQSAGEIVENSYEAYLQQSRAGLKVTAGAELETKCQACGAVIMMDAKTATQECPFCGVHLESQPKSAEAIVEPSAVLPFKVDQNGARKVFKQWVNSRWLAPNTFKQIGELGKLIGLYTPYWTFDAMTFTFYKGQRGTHYYATESFTAMVNGKPTPRTRQVRKTRWAPAQGQVRHWFDDVLVLASRGLPPQHAHELSPWDMNMLADFKPEFLSGFRTERYQVGLEEGFARAKIQMRPIIESLIRRDIGGDEQRIENLSTQYSGITFKHILLPIWISAYRYHNKLYRILINARTGEVQGDRPYSAWKIAGLVVLIAAIVGLLVLTQAGSPQ